LKEDDKVIASKKEDLKKKKEKLAKEAKEAEARKAAAKAKALAEEAARVLKAAQAEDAKAVADVQNAQKVCMICHGGGFCLWLVRQIVRCMSLHLVCVTLTLDV
jgi:hypothetical protein